MVNAITAELGRDQVTVIQHDSYYYDRSYVPPPERLHINYDHPDALETSLLVQHLKTLRSNRSVGIPIYDFAAHSRLEGTVTAQPRKAVIVEGILVLAEPELRGMMDIKVFVDTDSDLRIIRRMSRDINERGRTVESVVEQYLKTVRPMHLEFVEPSKRHAHIIIPEGGHNLVAVDMLITKIRSVIEESPNH